MSLLGEHRNVNSTRWHWAANVVAASPALGRAQRARILRRCGIGVRTAIVEPGCWFFGSDVDLGEWSFVNHRCYFDSRDTITLGAQVALAPEVMLATSGHLPTGGPENRRGPYTSGPIHVGAGSWLGTRVTVLGGLTIGEGCIVAAGAVVTKDLDPNGLYGGVPARRLRDLEA